MIAGPGRDDGDVDTVRALRHPHGTSFLPHWEYRTVVWGERSAVGWPVVTGT